MKPSLWPEYVLFLNLWVTLVSILEVTSLARYFKEQSVTEFYPFLTSRGCCRLAGLRTAAADAVAENRPFWKLKKGHLYENDKMWTERLTALNITALWLCQPRATLKWGCRWLVSLGAMSLERRTDKSYSCFTNWPNESFLAISAQVKLITVGNTFMIFVMCSLR